MLRIFDKIKILKDHFYSHVPTKDALDQIDAKILLLLNNTLDIHNLHHAVGKLRQRQEVCLQILRILNLIASRNELPYWLNYGTLLGAIRHQGFVPWDDDIDIGMLAKDCEIFTEILHQELSEIFKIDKWISANGEDVGIVRVTDTTSCCSIDLYSFDRIPGGLNANGIPTAWESEYQIEFQKISDITYRKGLNQEVLSKIARWMLSHETGDGDSVGIATSMTFVSARPMYRRVFRENDIFPLRTAIFEGIPLPVPANAEIVLDEIYNGYEAFPRDAGLALHSNPHCSALTPVEMRRSIDRLHEFFHVCESKYQLEEPSQRKR